MDILNEESLRKAYHDDELTQSECARRFGVSKRTIATRMKLYGFVGRTERNEAWKSKIARSMKGSNNPMFGVTGKNHPKFKYTDEVLLGKLQDFVDRLDRVPKVKDVGNTFMMRLVRRFGSYNAALEKLSIAGNPPHCPRKYTDDDILAEIKMLSKDGFAPTQREANTLAKRAEYRFGSYSTAVKLAGLKHKSNGRAGELNASWKGGYKDYYGPNWENQRRLTRHRDGYSCQLCSIKEAEYGKQLDVHHKIAFRKFGYIPGENDNYLEANKLSNLISLCNKCHSSIKN